MRQGAGVLAGIATLGVLLGTAVLSAPAPGHATGAYQHSSRRSAPDRVPALAPKDCDDPKPAETYAPIPYPQRMFGANRVWPHSTGAGVTIAVLDSGVDVGHPQLDGSNIGAGTDFMTRTGSGDGRYDCDGHGTAVASLIGAEKVDGVGFQGLAHGATILPVVVSAEHDESSNETATTGPEKFARAIGWAVRHGAQVINISLVITEDHPAVRQAIADAIDNDVVVVAAAGNGATEATQDGDEARPPSPGPQPYPASYADVIGVGAVGPAEDGHYPPLKTSQWGGYVDLAAPGGSVLVANLGRGHVEVTGNTYAAAFVSATVALVRAKWPELSAREVARRLYATASHAAGTRAKIGHGLVDPYRALTEGLSDEPPKTPGGEEPYSPDPKAVARAEEQRFTGSVALATAGIGVLLSGAMLATLTLLPRGRRRGWRPGRTKFLPEPERQDGPPPAPVRLFEDLEPR